MASIKIIGMKCGHCVGSVTEALTAISGISEVSVDLASGLVTYKETNPVPSEKIKDAVSAIGFEVEQTS